MTENVCAMKFLWVQRSVHTGGKWDLHRYLVDASISILEAATIEEAQPLLQLHGESLELLLISVHRGDPPGEAQGLALVEQILADPRLQDLAMVLVTQGWSAQECARHQQTPAGVNAYLSYPLEPQKTVEILEAVLGSSLGAPAMENLPAERPPIAPQDPSSQIRVSENPAPRPESTDSPRLEERQFTDQADGGALSFGEKEAPDPDRSAEALTFGLHDAAEAPLTGEENPSPEIAGAVTEKGEVDPVTSFSFNLGEGASPALELPTGASTLATEIVAPELEEPLGLTVSSAEPVPDDLPGLVPSPAASTSDTPDIAGQTVDIEADPLSGEDAPAPPSSSLAPGVSSALKEEAFVLENLPYLRTESPAQVVPFANPYLFAAPQGDAVVPGGTANSPDIQTLKNYLTLREQDVLALTHQLRGAQEELLRVGQSLSEERALGHTLRHEALEAQKELEKLRHEERKSREQWQGQHNELNFQVRLKEDRLQAEIAQRERLEKQLQQLRERVPIDIRRIRIREKELENHLEIQKKDTEALIAARENKIMELKRKIDLLEFNMDLLQDQFAREKELSARGKERLGRVAQVVQVASHLLDSPGEDPSIAIAEIMQRAGTMQ